MTIDHPLRRFLARFCSADTIARVVDPTLADMRFEDGRPTWRSCLALLRALTLHAVVSLPGSLSRLWSDDEHALPRAIVAGAVTTLIFGTLLMLPPVLEISPGNRLGIGVLRTIVLLSPQALGLALPASLLVAIPMGFRGAVRPRRIIARSLVLAVVCAAATYVVIDRMVPYANQTWREEVSAQLGGRVHLDRGPNELAFREMRERIEILRLTPGGVRAARSLEHTYLLRLMLSAITVPLGLLAVAIALSIRGRFRTVLVSVGALIASLSALFGLEYAGMQLMKRFEALPPAVVVWVPALAFLIVSSVALHRSMRHARTPTAAA